jgi:signal peptidase II
MAFGWELFDKLFLTIFRIAAVGAIVYYLHHLIKHKARIVYLLTISLILAGALGNIIDCVLYGVIFSESTIYEAATLFPANGGYAPMFYGKVVDMLYFPLIHNSAGEVLFFQPVFNIADSAITIAVFILLLFFRKDLNDSFEKQENQ